MPAPRSWDPWYSKTYLLKDAYPDFYKWMKAYDEHLSMLYNTKTRNWDLFRYHFLVCPFDHVDERTKAFLMEADMWRYKTVKAFEDYVDGHNNKIREEMRARHREELREQSRKAWLKVREIKDVFGWTPATDKEATG